MAKRCNFCGHKLNDKGYCDNVKCPESIRAKFNEAAENIEDDKPNAR